MGFWHKDPYPRETSYCKGQGKEQSFTSSLSPGGWAYSRALEASVRNKTRDATCPGGNLQSS